MKMQNAKCKMQNEGVRCADDLNEKGLPQNSNFAQAQDAPKASPA